jgi:PIN domain nuclease of toxin-antitoxin system
MRYLLDTAVFLWGLNEPERLNKRALAVLQDASQEVFLSAASTWEIVIKATIGKLKLPKEPDQLIPEALARFVTRALPITHTHSLAVGKLPRHHHDPFDRMLIAQARSENMILMTADSFLQNYAVETLWCGK